MENAMKERQDLIGICLKNPFVPAKDKERFGQSKEMLAESD